MTLNKSDLEGLKELKQKADDFTSAIFDWVAPLDQRGVLSTMYDFKSVIEKKIEELENDYWTFEGDDGEIFDGEFDSQAKAQEYADDRFADKCCDDGEMRNGETASEDIVLIHFKYDDEGEMVEIERVDSTVEYEHYHGDYAEHFRQSDYI